MVHRRLLQLGVTALVLGLAPARVPAQPVSVLERPVGAKFFGIVLATDGNLLVAGSREAAYLFDAGTGAYLRTLTRPVGSGVFGYSVAIGGNLVAATDPAPPPDDGMVQIFDATTGAHLRTIAPPPGARRGFGEPLAFAGTKLIVGSRSLTNPQVDPGGAYVFDATTGALLLDLQAPGLPNGSFFGEAVAAVGGNVLVGAFAASRAYLFDGVTGALLQTFASPGVGIFFGEGVAALGSNCLVADGYAGAVYLFDSVTGALLRTFAKPPTPNMYPRFGEALTEMAGDVLIGDWSEDKAYLFDGATGALLRTFLNPTPGPDYFASFNQGIAVAGDTIFISAFQDLVDGQYAGAVYRYCGGLAGCGPCETCGPGGSCVAAPHAPCLAPGAPGKSRLLVKNLSRDAADSLVWTWAGSFTRGTDFGQPLDTTDYALCLFDESGPASLAFRATAPAGPGDCPRGPCWRATPALQSFGYTDGAKTPDGVQSVRLKASAVGDGKLKVRALGEHLTDRPLGLPGLPLDLPVRVQLQARQGLCWEASYSSASQSTSLRFNATSD